MIFPPFSMIDTKTLSIAFTIRSLSLFVICIFIHSRLAVYSKEVSPFSNMMPRMFPNCKQDKILNAVVEFIAVFMVNLFPLFKRTADMLTHHYSMLKKSFSSYRDLSISISSNCTPFPPLVFHTRYNSTFAHPNTLTLSGTKPLFLPFFLRYCVWLFKIFLANLTYLIVNHTSSIPRSNDCTNARACMSNPI